MRRSLVGVLLLSSVIMTMGCRQTTTSGPLTPVGPFSAQGTSVRPASSLGPLGGSTRVPPPATGSYSVPNNYMGGGQVSINGSNQGFASNPIGQGVQQSGWVESNPDRRANGQANLPAGGQPFAGNAQVAGNAPLNGQAGPQSSRSLSPQLGGMRVIDLTRAPAPPGYQPQFNQGQGGYQGYQPSYPQYNQAPSAGFAPSGVAPATYLPGFGPSSDATIAGGFSQGSAYRPANEPMNQNFSTPSFQPQVQASAPLAQPSVPRIAQSPMVNQPREFPAVNSPMEPSFNGLSQFGTTTIGGSPDLPSTAPTDTSAEPNNFPWRRPALR